MGSRMFFAMSRVEGRRVVQSKVGRDVDTRYAPIDHWTEDFGARAAGQRRERDVHGALDLAGDREIDLPEVR